MIVGTWNSHLKVLAGEALRWITSHIYIPRSNMHKNPWLERDPACWAWKGKHNESANDGHITWRNFKNGDHLFLLFYPLWTIVIILYIVLSHLLHIFKTLWPLCPLSRKSFIVSIFALILQKIFYSFHCWTYYICHCRLPIRHNGEKNGHIGKKWTQWTLWTQCLKK